MHLASDHNLFLAAVKLPAGQLRDSYTWSDELASFSSASLEGFSVRSCSITDAQLDICWLCFDMVCRKTSPIRFELQDSPQWSADGFSGTMYRDATAYTLYIKASRNLTLDAVPDSNGVSIYMEQVRTGPTHIALLARPTNKGPLLRFKDVGSGENGGIKFRYRDEGFIFFDKSKETPPLVQGDMPKRDNDFISMRYCAGDLENIWEIGRDRSKRFG